MHPKRLENPDARCPRHPRKEYRQLIEKAWDAGWWCWRDHNNYIRCRDPEGKGTVPVPSTPSKQGTIHITARRFRALGLDV
jgi:hypothetical protein